MYRVDWTKGTTIIGRFLFLQIYYFVLRKGYHSVSRINQHRDPELAINGWTLSNEHKMNHGQNSNIYASETMRNFYLFVNYLNSMFHFAASGARQGSNLSPALFITLITKNVY
jgi:hypothetical protein